MMFMELNNGKKINLFHCYAINQQGNTIIYKSAKGLGSDIVEYYDTEQEAIERKQELDQILVNASING